MSDFVDPTDTLDAWFRRCALANPSVPALEVGAEVVTYGELVTLTDHVARSIAGLVARPRVVGVLASRSLATYAGYLAALRCGAIVVPLNPVFPVARTIAMCRLAGVQVIVHDDSGTDTVAEVVAATGIAPLCLPVGFSRQGNDPAGSLDLPPRQAAAPDDVAYLLFTSGSTGTPKGVPIRHRNLAGYLRTCIRRYETGPGSRLSQTFDLTFDPSVFDMFVAWCSGATLVVPQADEVILPSRFVAEKAITHWFSVPSVISLGRSLRAVRPGSMPTLRWSLFAGEQLTIDQARTWAAAAPNSTIENLYGPTELTVTCTGYRLPPEQATWPVTSNGTVPIGMPYEHLEAEIVGEDGRPGDEGELCMRGSQRFDGYLNLDHDAGRFYATIGDRTVIHNGRPDPDSWYRTGDRVRNEGGLLVHLGRIDDQIKIRGYRIELGEIEALLRNHPKITDAVVLGVTTRGAEAVIHALYTGTRVEDSELKALAGEQLPPYMVPASFGHRDAFPLNANGKIDRRRLSSELES